LPQTNPGSLEAGQALLSDAQSQIDALRRQLDELQAKRTYRVIIGMAKPPGAAAGATPPLTQNSAPTWRH
jgi:hypothetical protein